MFYFSHFSIFHSGESALGRYVCQTDTLAGELFDEANWSSTLDQPDPDNVDWEQILDKIVRYLHSASSLLNVPIAQAMINVKSHGSVSSGSDFLLGISFSY